VASARFPDPIRLRVDRPDSFFEKRILAISHMVDKSRTIAELDLSVVAKPDEVTCAFHQANDSVQLSPTQGFGHVDIRIHDLSGQLTEYRQITETERSQDGTFALMEPGGLGSFYFDLTLSGSDRLSNRIIIPYYGKRASNE